MKPKKDSPIEDMFPRSLTPEREAELWRTCVSCTLKKRVLKNVAWAYEQICRDSFTPNPSSPGVFDVDPRTMADLRMTVRAFLKHVDAKKAPTAEDTKTLLETVIRACERRSQRNTSSEPEMNNRMELIVFAENRNLFSGPADKADCAPFEICDIAPLYQRVEPQVERILKKMNKSRIPTGGTRSRRFSLSAASGANGGEPATRKKFSICSAIMTNSGRSAV